MEAAWTKETLRLSIVDMQTNIDRITRKSNFSVIQRRVLLDFKKRAQSATRAFMEKHREVQGSHAVSTQDANYLLQQYKAYSHALDQQKQNKDDLTAPLPPSFFPPLPAKRTRALHPQQACLGEQEAPGISTPALSMPSLRASGPGQRSTSAS